MGDAWTSFYWGDYISDTGHLSLMEHGAYLLLMAHYYRTRRPLRADIEQLCRICRVSARKDSSERRSVEAVLQQFFFREGGFFRHKRIDAELAKSADISQKRRSAAFARHYANASANAAALAEQLHTQPQPQSQLQEEVKASARERAPIQFTPPTLEEVANYCNDRGNDVDPEKWLNYYTANGWKVGRNPMKDWRAAVRTWERNGNNNNSKRHHDEGREKIRRAAERHSGPADERDSHGVSPDLGC